jgi:DNA-binding transcriptional LysR family regulator
VRLNFLSVTIEAATQLGLSQFAVSRLLAQFEKEAGLHLFKRSKGRLLPTGEAYALLRDAQGMIESAQCLRRHADRLRLGGFRRNLIKAAVPHTLALQLMPSVVGSFIQKQQGTVVEVLSMSYVETEKAILSREVDIGIVRAPVALSGLEIVQTFTSEAVCIMPRKHPLQRLKAVACADLEDVPLVLTGRQQHVRQEIDHAFRKVHFLPRILCEVHAVGVACAFVAKGLGVSIVNGTIARHCESMGFVTRPFLPKISLSFGVAMVNDARQNALAQEFAAELVNAIQQPGLKPA